MKDNRPEILYDYWKKLDSWTVQEAIILSFGYDPDNLGTGHVNDIFSELLSTKILQDFMTLIKKQYLNPKNIKGGSNNVKLIYRRVRMIQSGISEGHLKCKYDEVQRICTVLPSDFISYALSKGFSSPERLKLLTPVSSSIDPKDIINSITMSLDETGNVLVKHPGKSPIPYTAQSMGFKNNKTKGWNFFKSFLEASDRCYEIGKPSSKDGNANSKIIQEINIKLNKFFKIEKHAFFTKVLQKPSFRQFTIKPIPTTDDLKTLYTWRTQRELINNIKKLQKMRDNCPDEIKAEEYDIEIRDLVGSGLLNKTLSNEEAEDLYSVKDLY